VRRRLNIRQIEAFKAVMENGTVSRAALLLNISQPAMSKLIAHLEADTGLKLFDRRKGRLAPNEFAARLYDEVDRIFAGVRQVENAVDAIHREAQGHLAIGVMPALAGPFIQRVMTCFHKDRPNVFCSVQSVSSQWIIDRSIARKLDLGLVSVCTENPYVIFESLMEHPLVCIMPLEHPLTAKSHLEPQDLDRIPFVSFNPDRHIGHCVEGIFETYKVKPQISLVVNVAPTLCEFVASGLGVSLVHPLMVCGLEHRLAVRRFEPEMPFDFKLFRSVETRNAQLVEAFAQDLRSTADQVFRSVLSKS
jgi:DNA-binding transcriptional LysR family regulator